MAIRVRPISEADIDALGAIDAEYAARHGVESALSAGALRFFGRNEHSFTAELLQGHDPAPRPVGFVFAQALWTGDRPLVLMTRLASVEGVGAESALLKALVKSAYDAGVYDLLARVPATHAAALEVLGEESFRPDPQLAFVRVLGSRGAEPQAVTSGGGHG